jgi:FtsP/CotA-like multicopper oxidase with cupredoxin domain
VAETTLNITCKPVQGITINGAVPGPVLRFHEGDEVVIRVNEPAA